MVISNSHLLWLVGISIVIAISAGIQYQAFRSRLSALPMAQAASLTLALFSLLVVSTKAENNNVWDYALLLALFVAIAGFSSVQLWLNKWLLQPNINLTLVQLLVLVISLASVVSQIWLPMWGAIFGLAVIALSVFIVSVWLAVKSTSALENKLLTCVVPVLWLAAIACSFINLFLTLLLVCISALVSQYLVLSKHASGQQQQIKQLEIFVEDYRNKSFKLQAELTEQHHAYESLESDMRERNFELEVTLRELQDKNRELEQLNTLDALTGVRNRRYFDQRIEAEIRRARREQSELGLIMLDIDHFKNINDEHGHLVGDQVIQHIAAFCKKLLPRSTDALCRYGGEEFAIVLPNTPLEGVRQVADNLCQQIEKSVCHIEELQISVTASLGVHAQLISHQTRSADLVELADKALYLAKQSGRNQVRQAGELSQIHANMTENKTLLN